MPKLVDHEERRRHIAEAVLEITATRGLEAASIRDVAAEAGASLGMIQHYFENKDEMLLFACEYLVERTRKRIGERIATFPESRTARSGLRHTFVEMLPLDEERRAGIWVWLAFLARAGVRPELEEAMRETWVDSHQFIAEQLRLAQKSGELSADLDPDGETVALLCLVDGLVSHVLTGHYSGEEALAAVDRQLDRLFDHAKKL